MPIEQAAENNMTILRKQIDLLRFAGFMKGAVFNGKKNKGMGIMNRW